MQTRFLDDLALEHDAEASFTRIGLLLLSTDLTTERDFTRFFTVHDLRLHAARLAYVNPVTPCTLRAMTPRLTETAALLPPDTPLAAVYYACASGSVVIGDAAITQAVRAARPLAPELPVITPVSAAVQALRALKARRISILAPYVTETALPVAGYFAEHGFEVMNLACLGLQDDRDMARIAPKSLVQAAALAMHPEAEALFVSCTALRAMEVVAQMEHLLGRPVVTSNQAAAWSISHHCGLDSPSGDYGQLLGLPLP